MKVSHSNRGAKGKLTPELIEEITTFIGAGNTDINACTLARIDKTTFYRWMRRGRGIVRQDEEHEAAGKPLLSDRHRDARYRKFYEAMEMARAQWEASLITAIAADSSWQSKAWLLERRFPEKYCLRNILQRLRTSPNGMNKIEPAPTNQMVVLLPELEDRPQ